MRELVFGCEACGDVDELHEDVRVGPALAEAGVEALDEAGVARAALEAHDRETRTVGTPGQVVDEPADFTLVEVLPGGRRDHEHLRTGRVAVGAPLMRD